ncbi:3-deoxy-D-manno-octulosonic acid transferase [Pseudogemmobacter sp. W21_MBD1_M6]|uniref:3-deoxy-D-manno-octulosonic acid transferase n=1 Tax=Pseudogemmobacter sp. W21_MBD1_M6 TaxID=3240271 RepID=UPI003F9C8520
MRKRFPSIRLRFVLFAYALLWWVCLPLVLLYLRRRARRDPVYGAHLGERFGRYVDGLKDAVWVHAVSLGEMRSATPLIRAMLNRGERVVTTHFTPAGRREAERVFAADLAGGRFRAVWVPFEFGFAFRRFFRAFTPKYGLVMEIEIWPQMIMAARASGVPLFMCNAQYPAKSFARDQERAPFRAELMQGFAGALVKSEAQRRLFASVGVRNIAVTGELRFDQAVPPLHLAAARAARRGIAGGRSVVTIASAVEGEDETYIDAIRATIAAKGADAPLFIYVPRAPERFDEVGQMIVKAGLRLEKRSEVFDEALALKADPQNPDVILGDSMGEMYFYLELADRAIVGGGFNAKGAHNVIEPLALKKPVIVGPQIWTIEYPAMDAIAAGVCLQVQTPAALIEALIREEPVPANAINAFFKAHSGGVARTLAAIPELLASTSR